MPKFLVTYDLERTDPDPHSSFLLEAPDKGWAPYVWGAKSKKWLRLPNTTLIGEFDNMSAASSAFDAIATATRANGYLVNVEKYMLVQYDGWQADSDEKSSS